MPASAPEFGALCESSRAFPAALKPEGDVVGMDVAFCGACSVQELKLRVE